MKTNYLVCFLFLLLAGCSVNNNSNFSEDTAENIFSISSFQFVSDSLIEYDIILSVNNRDLIFKKNDNIFNSKLSFHIKVINKDNSVIYNDAWSENFEMKYYEDTQSMDQIFIDRKLLLSPGEFELFISIDDYENHKNWNIKQNLEFKLDDSQLSDIAILYKKDGEMRYLLNNQFVEDLDTLWVKYQVYDNQLSDDSLKCIVSSTPENSNNSNDNDVFNKEIDFLFNNDLKEKEINVIPISLHDIESNNLYISIYYKDIIKSRNVKIKNIASKEIDYFKLIGPMEYVLNYSEYLEFLELEESSQIDFIENFWNRRYNKELFDEFIKRVKYSEANFSLFLEGGWESDRGRIYIKYGEPLDVSFEFNQRGEFEIWTYQNNQRFIFKNNLGMYELYDSTY